MSKLVRSGDQLAVGLPTSIVESLQLFEGDEVSVILDEQSGYIVIAPSDISLDSVSFEFTREVVEFIEHYRPALEELAK